MKKFGFSTRQIHPDGHHKPEQAHVMPIGQTATFYFNTTEEQDMERQCGEPYLEYEREIRRWQ